MKRSNFKLFQVEAESEQIGLQRCTTSQKSLKGCKLQASKLVRPFFNAQGKALLADAPPESAYHRTMSDLTMLDSQFVEDKITFSLDSDVHDES